MKITTCLIVLLVMLWSCSTIKFDSVYSGYSNEGHHSRGLSETGGYMVVVSGSNGYYAWFDLRKNEWFRKDSILNMEDFRDVHIKTNERLILLNSGTKGNIWSANSGSVKQLKYDTTNVFLDGLSFYPHNDFEAFAYGDPVDSNFLVFKTTNGGDTWVPISADKLPVILTNEAGFAASGTGIQTPEKDVIFIGTGVADTARVMRSFDGGKSWDVVNTPMKSGDHYGIYSMFFNSKTEGFVIGGSYKDSLYNENICYYTTNSGEKWINRSKGLPGYMSCIHGNSDLSIIVATGRIGTYYSQNKGQNWELLTKTAYYSCLLTDSQIVLSGRNGMFEVINYTLTKP